MALHSITRGFISLALATGLAGFTNPTSAITLLEMAIDTSSLTGTMGQLAFDLTNGDTAVNNKATITAFSTDGILGSSSAEGEVSGALDAPPYTVTLTDTALFNELLQLTIRFIESEKV